MWRLRIARYAIRHQASGAFWRDRDSAPALSGAAAAGDLTHGKLLLRSARIGARGAHAIEHPDIVDRMFEGRDGRAGSKHPAAEYGLGLLVDLALDDLEVSSALRRFFRRTLVTSLDGDFQRAE